MNNNEIDVKINCNADELEKAADTMERIGDAMPNIVIRNNQNVYLTINNWTNNCDCKEIEEDE